MKFLLYLYIMIVFAVALVGITQIIMPLIRGTALFPLFRRQAKLEQDLRGLEQQHVERGLQTQINAKRRANRYKKSK